MDEVAHCVSQQFFYMNPSNEIESKLFNKVDIKQNNVSTIILLINFLVIGVSVTGPRR